MFFSKILKVTELARSKYIVKDDMLFWIPIQTATRVTPIDMTLNGNDPYDISVVGSDLISFKIPHNATLDTLNVTLGELFWDDATKTPKDIIVVNLVENLLGLNLLFCNVNGIGSDFILYSTQRNSSSVPSIEEVNEYVGSMPIYATLNGDTATLNGDTKTL